jgi:hypothetical protein
MPFKDRKDARAKARRGGLARAAKMREKTTGPAPYAGDFLQFLADAGIDGPSWAPWKTLWRLVAGEPLSDAERELFVRCTGRQRVPAGPLRECWLVCGRRGGKSRNLAARAVWEAIRRDYREILAAGERAAVAVVAADRKQAALVLRYVRGLAARPAVAPYLGRVLKDSASFSTGCDVVVMTASHQTTRGYSLAAALCDEAAFWTTDETGASPDTEVLAALKPGLATIPGAMLVCASTPYSRRGALWLAFERSHGQDAEDAVLVWRAPSLEMNPSLDPAVVAEAYERDPAAAAAEWGAEFRSDVQAFMDRDAIRAVTVPGRRELPPSRALRYSAFTDPSGGSVDSFTLAIGHSERERGAPQPITMADAERIAAQPKSEVAVLDAIREVRPPFSPEAVVAEFSELLKTYRCSAVTGDHYAGIWPAAAFAKCGIRYVTAEKPKSDFYRELLPLVNAGRVELLDVPRLAAQLVGLERRTARSGKDSIDHQPGAHDDVANVVAGVLVGLAAGGQGRVAVRIGTWGM